MKHVYSSRDIVDSLHAAGLSEGDSVFVHANLGFFGQLTGAATSEQYGHSFLDAFLEVIGATGTLCVPVFTYSFCNGKPFDPETTPSSMGLFSEYVRQCRGAVRSPDPNFSIAAIGRRAIALTEEPASNSFGHNSFWDRFLRYDGTICNLNFDAGSTFIHFIEKQNRVPYRFDKAFQGRIRVHGEWRDETFHHFVHDLDRGDLDTSMPKVDWLLREYGLVKTTQLGRGSIVAYSSRACFDLLTMLLREDPYILTKGSSHDRSGNS